MHEPILSNKLLIILGTKEATKILDPLCFNQMNKKSKPVPVNPP